MSAIATFLTISSNTSREGVLGLLDSFPWGRITSFPPGGGPGSPLSPAFHRSQEPAVPAGDASPAGSVGQCGCGASDGRELARLGRVCRCSGLLRAATETQQEGDGAADGEQQRD